MVNINVFSQILALIDRSIFNSLVEKHQSDKHSKGINSWTHLVSMLFCHLSSADSVRDISNGLRSTTGNMRSTRGRSCVWCGFGTAQKPLNMSFWQTTLPGSPKRCRHFIKNAGKSRSSSSSSSSVWKSPALLAPRIMPSISRSGQHWSAYCSSSTSKRRQNTSGICLIWSVLFDWTYS